MPSTLPCWQALSLAGSVPCLRLDETHPVNPGCRQGCPRSQAREALPPACIHTGRGEVTTRGLCCLGTRRSCGWAVLRVCGFLGPGLSSSQTRHPSSSLIPPGGRRPLAPREEKKGTRRAGEEEEQAACGSQAERIPFSLRCWPCRSVGSQGNSEQRRPSIQGLQPAPEELGWHPSPFAIPRTDS